MDIYEGYPEPDHPLFYKKITKLFSNYKIDRSVIEKEVVPDFCVRIGAKKEAKAYQKFVSEYLSEETPYRGLLVYHGLGSGKTITGIRTMNKNPSLSVVVISPASLRNWWKINVKRRYNGNKKVYFIAHNAPNFIDQIKKVGSLNNKLIIIDESHIFFQNVISGKAKQAIEVFERLFHSINSKFLLLTGTPISGDPFELVPVFNLLKGKMILDTQEQKRLKKKYTTLFPINRQEFWNNFASDEYNSIKNREVFIERTMGLISYYKGLKDDYRYVVPENLGMKVIDSPMGHILLGTYLNIRKEEARIEQIYKYKTTAFKEAAYKKAERKSTGTYKVNSRMVSNFSVGPKVEEIYTSIPKIKKKEKIDWSHIIREFPKLKDANLPERKLEVAEIKWKLFEGLLINHINTINDLKHYSSKLAKLLEMISDPKKRKYKKFIYSEYRIFGTRLIGYFLTKILGFHEIRNKDDIEKYSDKYKGFCIIDGDTKNKDIIKDLYNSKNNVYGENISIILGTKVVSAGYSFKNVKEIYIFEPQWRDITIEQIIGRPIRLCSHQDLPIQEREVQTYLLISTPPKTGRTLLPRADAGLSTDEILYNLANSKSEFINTFLHAIKEAAVDCQLNIYVNQKTQKEINRERDISDIGNTYKDVGNIESEDIMYEYKIKCKVCNSNVPDAIIIPKDYKDHIISGPRCVMEELSEKLYPVTKKDGLIKGDIRHEGLKKDINDTIYQFQDDIWKEIGYTTGGQIFIYSDEI